MQRKQFALLLTLLILVITTVSVLAQDETAPESVTLIGSIQTAFECAGDDATCEATQLELDESGAIWITTLRVPAGSYDYTAVFNGDASATAGEPIAFEVDKDTSVTIWYAPETGWLADNVNSFLATVPGSYQNEAGCPDLALDDSGSPGDWAPGCNVTLLQDPDGDGIYVFRTTVVPAGDYEAKVAIDQLWTLNYGEGGAEGGANIRFVVPEDGKPVTFTWDSESKEMTIEVEGAPKGDLDQAKANWVSADTILTDFDAEPGTTFLLYVDSTGNLTVTEQGIEGGTTIELTASDEPVSAEIATQFPHLARRTVLKLPEDQLPIVPDLLRGQFALGVLDADGTLIDATGLQIPGVIDDFYQYDGELGVSWDGDVPTLRVWAPTAQAVDLVLYEDGSAENGETIPMERDDATGVWSVTGSADWNGEYYTYRVTVYAPAAGEIVENEVTDPYSVSLATNSTRSQIVNLDDTSLKPEGWDTLDKPEIAAPEDIILYELHLRDFSASDETVPEEARGTFKAFTYTDSNGMTHLRNLADAGLTHIHMLPLFDIATINENKDEWRAPLPTYLATFPPDSDKQQAAIYNLRDEDGFNWGYDPLHYTVPEGSYSTNPEGTTRIVEFREMVQALNENDLRVVMDVVYNHTNASGQSDKSVLDRIVPGYYHRLDVGGAVANSTCCANTATEHDMMRKLMVDSIVTWAKAYKVDGFRFDLMGHHMVEDMVAVREALDALTLEADGVDGKSIYLYGEGWNFGEVGNNARGVNATQLNVGGLGIGTFNDRIRDAVRGGNPFGGQQEQGFATGLYTDPNEATEGGEGLQKVKLLQMSDQIRVGLAGNLADYEFEDATGTVVSGKEVDYNGSPAGYTQDPQEHIIYVSAHDNETLFDAIQYKAPLATSTEERARMQNLALDLVMFSQGVPFFHAGSDMLRSKSMDRDSYNSGDWFNVLDFTMESNGWGMGLPVADKNESMWPVIGSLLANPDLQPAPEDIAATAQHFQESLQIRQSSPLFRLQSAESISNRLQFHNTGPEQIPGLIAMSISDTVGEDLDPNLDSVVVLFNADNQAQTFMVDAYSDADMQLHPVQQNSADSRLSEASFENGAFTVPARSTVVFVEGLAIVDQAETDASEAAVAAGAGSGSADSEGEVESSAETTEDHGAADSEAATEDEHGATESESSRTEQIGESGMGITLTLLLSLLCFVGFVVLVAITRFWWVDVRLEPKRER